MREEVPDEHAGRRKSWLIVFVISLFVLALFWSIDPAVFYILTGACAFSLYMFLQYRKPRDQREPFEYRQQQAYSARPSAWEEFTKLFTGTSNRNTQKSANVIKLVIIIFAGLVFFSVLIPIILNDGSAEEAADALQKGRDFYQLQQYDSAARYYGIAIRRGSGNADIYLERGNAFLAVSQYDSAMADYDRALALKPDFKEAFYNKGLIHYNRKQYRPGIDEVKNAIAIDPDYSEAMLLIGDCFYNSSLLDSAMVWYEDAYSRGYRGAGLSHVIAYIHDTKGRVQQAVPLYKEALEYDSTRTEIYSRLGELVPGEEGNFYRQKAAQYSR